LSTEFKYNLTNDSIKNKETNLIDPGVKKTDLISVVSNQILGINFKNLANMYVPMGHIIYSGGPHAASGP